ncbi:MAG: hypothetical protein OXC44_00775 [Proteobacteria bacterium]|nr:hypothetical protein [Pseudomonadota bacterium]
MEKTTDITTESTALSFLHTYVLGALIVAFVISGSVWFLCESVLCESAMTTSLFSHTIKNDLMHMTSQVTSLLGILIVLSPVIRQGLRMVYFFKQPQLWSYKHIWNGCLLFLPVMVLVMIYLFHQRI